MRIIDALALRRKEKMKILGSLGLRVSPKKDGGLALISPLPEG